MKNIVQSKRYTKFWISGVALFVLLALSACKSIKPPDSLVNDTDIKLESGSKKLDPYLGFNKTYTLAAASAADRTLDASLRQADLLAEGMALVKASCESYKKMTGKGNMDIIMRTRCLTSSTTIIA